MTSLFMMLALTGVTEPAGPAAPAIPAGDDVLQYDDGGEWEFWIVEGETPATT
jgi:hypothetical protein